MLVGHLRGYWKDPMDGLAKRVEHAGLCFELGMSARA